MITVELKEDEITGALVRLAGLTGDLSPILSGIGELLAESTKVRMAAGVSPDGTAFAPRAASTLARYKKLGKSYGLPLHLTGEMARQVNYNAGADFVEVGTTSIQAAVMQFGAAQGEFGAFMGKDKLGRDHFHAIPWGNIPARPFIGLSDEDRTNILDEIAEQLVMAATP